MTTLATSSRQQRRLDCEAESQQLDPTRAPMPTRIQATAVATTANHLTHSSRLKKRSREPTWANARLAEPTKRQKSQGESSTVTFVELLVLIIGTDRDGSSNDLLPKSGYIRLDTCKISCSDHLRIEWRDTLWRRTGGQRAEPMVATNWQPTCWIPYND